jgi:hypothetical protein
VGKEVGRAAKLGTAGVRVGTVGVGAGGAAGDDNRVSCIACFHLGGDLGPSPVFVGSMLLENKKPWFVSYSLCLKIVCPFPSQELVIRSDVSLTLLDSIEFSLLASACGKVQDADFVTLMSGFTGNGSCPPKGQALLNLKTGPLELN